MNEKLREAFDDLRKNIIKPDWFYPIDYREAIKKVMEEGATGTCPKCGRVKYTEELTPNCKVCSLESSR